MELTYGDLLHPFSINVEIGHIRKPKLKEIFEFGKDEYNKYISLLLLTPKTFLKDGELWQSFSTEEQEKLTMLDFMAIEPKIRNLYLNVFDFFFVEKVVAYEDVFILLNIEDNEEITEKNIVGSISRDNFQEICSLILQICHIKQKKTQKQKFKNKLAEKLFNKMNPPKDSENQNDNSLENIISAIVAWHPSLNFTNIWELTVFQLYDTFERLQINEVYSINSISASIWGDKENNFKIGKWYSNFNNKGSDTVDG